MLEEFPETQINIDLKDQEERLVARVEEVVKAHGAENRYRVSQQKLFFAVLAVKNTGRSGCLPACDLTAGKCMCFWQPLLPVFLTARTAKNSKGKFSITIERRCVWGNFSQWTTEQCHKANPSVGLLFSMPRSIASFPSRISSCTYRFVKLYILFYTGLLPFVPLKETHLEIPMPSIFYDDNYRLAKPDGVSRLEFGHRMNTF